MHFVNRLLILVVVSLILQGCSAVRLGYNNADSLIRWWIDQYVDLSPEQDALVRERLTRLHAWHRKTQLPNYAVFLREVQNLIAGQPTSADFLALVDEIARRGQTLAEQVGPDIADFLLTVTPEQIENMAGRFEKRNAAHAEEIGLASGERGQRKTQFKRVLEQSEYWFGGFSAAQKAALRQAIESQASGTQFWFDERLRHQREWLDLMRLVEREHPPRERIIELLRDYVAHDMPSDPARLAQARALRRNAAELGVAIHAMATPEQRAHAEHKLEDMANDFTELSRNT